MLMEANKELEGGVEIALEAVGLAKIEAEEKGAAAVELLEIVLVFP